MMAFDMVFLPSAETFLSIHDNAKEKAGQETLLPPKYP
jgi:hypothetical protein